jgi:hypothetical protein
MKSYYTENEAIPVLRPEDYSDDTGSPAERAQRDADSLIAGSVGILFLLVAAFVLARQFGLI